MNRTLMLVTTGILGSFGLLHGPSTAEELSEPIAPLQTFAVSNNVRSVNILGEAVTEARYRKPNAYEAEHAIEADLADTAIFAESAESAARAGFAVRIEEKLPYGQAWSYSLSQRSPGSRNLTQRYIRPAGANSVLVHANCVTAGEKGDLSEITVYFNAGFTRTVDLCESGRTSGTEEHNRAHNVVNLDVPQGATELRITQRVSKRNNRGTANTAGMVQWFGPHSTQTTSTGPTTVNSGSTTFAPPPPPSPIGNHWCPELYPLSPWQAIRLNVECP